MSLDAMQQKIIRIVTELPAARRFALAGGGAMLAHGFIDRITRDLDFFSPDGGEVGPATEILATALRQRGYDVTVARKHETFARLAVTDDSGERIDVDIAQDAFLHEPVMLSVGRVISADEVAAAKTLALFGRAEARDLADVDALTHHFDRERLLELAARADTGFARTYFADALDRAATRPDGRFIELGVTPETLRSIRRRARDWSRHLRGSNLA